jgi:hypothetical protein
VDRTETHRAGYKLTVKESANGRPWLMFEPLRAVVPILRINGKSEGFLGFEVSEGTTYVQAWEIARYLNEHVEQVTCTVFGQLLERIAAGRGIDVSVN